VAGAAARDSAARVEAWAPAAEAPENDDGINAGTWITIGLIVMLLALLVATIVGEPLLREEFLDLFL